MDKILIIKTGETFENLKNQKGDFHNWIISFSHMDKDIFSIIDFNTPGGKINLNIEKYIDEQKEYLEANKFNIEKIKQKITTTSHANKIIENFCSYSLKKQ